MNGIKTYGDIWMVDKRRYFADFKNGPLTADVFDSKIILYATDLTTYLQKKKKRKLTFHIPAPRRYTDKLNAIKEIKTETVVSCSVIQIDVLKEQMIKHCQDWISRFSRLLLYETDKLIDSFYDYIKFNGTR